MQAFSMAFSEATSSRNKWDLVDPYPYLFQTLSRSSFGEGTSSKNS